MSVYRRAYAAPLARREFSVLATGQIACLMLASVIPVTFVDQDDAPAGKKFKPTAVFTGTHSQITKETIRLIATAEDWKPLWEAHRGNHDSREFTETDQQFDIDFESHYVVAIFTWNCDRCHVSPRLRDGSVVIGFEAVGYQIEGGPLGEGKAPTESEKRESAKRNAANPYAFVVLPKPVRTVIIEKAHRRELGTAAVWKAIKTFPIADTSK